MTNAIRHTLLWNLTLGVPMPLDEEVHPEWRRAIERLIADRRARVNGQQQLVACPPPGDVQITAWTRLTLITLTAEGPVDSQSWPRRGAVYGLDETHLRAARQRLFDDRLLDPAAAVDGLTRLRLPAPKWLRALTPEQVGLVRVAPAAPESREPVAGRARLGRLEPEAHEPPEPVAPAPAPPAPAPPAPVVTRPPRPSKPIKAAPVGAATLATELLARIAVAAEMQARLSATTAARRDRPALGVGVSPLLDTQRRIAVVIAAADGGQPVSASELAARHLTRGQRAVMDVALADGVTAGVFAATGGLLGRGARYLLKDPTPLGLTWDEVQDAARTIRARRALRAG